MNRLILFSLIAGLTSVLALAVFVNRGFQFGLFSSSERAQQLTVTAPDYNEPAPPPNHETGGQFRNAEDTSNSGGDPRFSAQRERQALKAALNRAPHDSGLQPNDGAIRKLDSPVNMDTGTKTILRKNRFQFRSLPDERANFLLTDLAGETHALRDHQGEWILINFWTSWCPPCREEMPSMKRFYKRQKDDNFTILAVNLKESRRKARTFAENFGLPFPLLLDQDGTIASDYGIVTIPTTWLINPNGKPVARLLGPLDWTKPEIVRAFKRLTSIPNPPDSGKQ